MDEKTTPTLLEAVAEYSNFEEAVAEINIRPYALQLQAGTLDPDGLSLSELTVAMETAAFLGIQFDSLLDEWLFRIGRSNELIGRYYSQIYDNSYTLKAPVSGVIASALKLRYGNPPYAPWHLNLAICLSTPQHTTEAAKVHNYALFRRCQNSPENGISDLKCFQYASRDVIWSPLVVENLFNLAVTKLSFKVAHYILLQAPSFKPKKHALATIIAHSDYILEYLIQEDRLDEKELDYMPAYVLCKYHDQLRRILEAKYQLAEQTVSTIYITVLSGRYPFQSLEHLISAGYKIPDHIKTTVHTFSIINTALLEFLISKGVPMSNIQFHPHLVSEMCQIKELDKLGFKWQDHFFHMMHSRLPEIDMDISWELLKRCKWADYTYYHYILNCRQPHMVSIMHSYAVEYDPAKCLSPSIILDVRNTINPADWIFYTNLIRPHNCGNCHVKPPTSKICSRCRMVTYCDQACQKSHWSQHKHECA